MLPSLAVLARRSTDSAGALGWLPSEEEEEGEGEEEEKGAWKNTSSTMLSVCPLSNALDEAWRLSTRTISPRIA